MTCISVKHKYEMGDTVQVACDDIAKGLNALHCIELHIISDLSTVVVLWPFSICNCLPPLFRAGFAQPLSELIFCHIYHTDCAMFNLFHTHQHILHIWSYIFFNTLWCTNTKKMIIRFKVLILNFCSVALKTSHKSNTHQSGFSSYPHFCLRY